MSTVPLIVCAANVVVDPPLVIAIVGAAGALELEVDALYSCTSATRMGMDAGVELSIVVRHPVAADVAT